MHFSRYCNTTKVCFDPRTTNCTNTASQTFSTNDTTTNLSSTTTDTTSTSTNSPTSVGNYCFRRTSATAVSNNCTQYHYFYNTTTSGLFVCPTPLLFNSFKKCCMSPSQIFTTGCSADPNKPSTNNISCTNIGRKIENILQCNSYYYCNSSYKIEMKECPSGQLFDWTTGACTSAFNATTVPGCTTTKYNQCINNNSGLRGQICNALTWGPRFLFKNLNNYCKSFLCTVLWFI